jgi:hypothetical protein
VGNPINLLEVKAELEKISENYNFTEGYHLLYCPEARIHDADVAFVSLNPGAPPRPGYNHKVLSNEEGNNYVLEEEITRSPITAQYLKLCNLIGQDAEMVLTGAFCPFRSKSWKDFDKEKMAVGLAAGTTFWSKVLQRKFNYVFCIGGVTGENISKILPKKESTVYDSGWGNAKIKVDVWGNGTKVITLPHLSRYKLLSNAKSQDVLRRILL